LFIWFAAIRLLEVYVELRDRWEYGHVAAFIFWLIGVSLLVLSVLVETPHSTGRPAKPSAALDQERGSRGGDTARVPARDTLGSTTWPEGVT
jgi:hypothetical protein